MDYKLLVLSVIAYLAFTGCASRPTTQKVAVIFDTDIGPDYDDVGAIAALHALADSGEANILATVASNKYEGIAAVLDVFNTYFGRPHIPIGVPKGDAVDMRDSQHWTDTLLKRYPHQITSNNEVPDAVEVYRKVLASQPDTSVTIVTVGFLTNLANLLETGPDLFSPLDGKELVKKKVKLLVSMAGAFPSGREFNLYNDTNASMKVFNNWPTKLIFSGFEIGKSIKTGLPLIHNNQIQNSPVKDVFKICIPMSRADSAGRMSWDESTVLTALKGYQPYFTLQEGKIVVNADGSNGWDTVGKGQYYLVQKESPQQVAEVIDRLMMHQPVKE